jgi:hypothetical protein
MLTKLQHTLEYRRKPDEQLCEHLNVKRCSLEGGGGMHAIWPSV